MEGNGFLDAKGLLLPGEMGKGLVVSQFHRDFQKILPGVNSFSRKLCQFKKKVL